MKPRLLPAILILAAMITAPVAAYIMRPTELIADHGPRVDLESMVPKGIGDWRLIPGQGVVVPDPQLQQLIERTYDQLLTRTYENAVGYRIMLSVAYGSDQRDTLQVHRPEVCYANQGFQIFDEVATTLATRWGNIPIKRLVTVQNSRNEPVTYWIVVGGKATPSGLRNKLTRLVFGLTGKIPDGILVRVSSIDQDEERAFAVQAAFLREILDVLTPAERLSFAGLAQP